MASVDRDQDRRDGQYRNHIIMDVATYPTSTFMLTSPTALGSVRAKAEITEKATGPDTARADQRVTFDAGRTATATGSAGTARSTFVFDEWGIQARRSGRPRSRRAK